MRQVAITHIPVQQTAEDKLPAKQAQAVKVNLLRKPLEKGDKIAIVATARKINETEITNAVSILKGWGLEVVFAPYLFEEENQYAGNDNIRSKSLQLVLDDPSIKAIFCARGGYGTVRIIDALDFTAFNDTPKWIIGYSDITVLHAHIFTNFKLPSIHAIMAFNMQTERAHNESIESLRKVIFAEPNEITFLKHSLNQHEKNVSGILTGGNLSVLYSILGSKSETDLTDKILFLEDLDEYLYHIDRMMQGLKRSGKLKHLKALVVGDMSDMKDNIIPFGKSAYEIIAESISTYNYPVFFGAPCGHERRNLALMFGVEYNLISSVEGIIMQQAGQPA
ncbi:MAG: LD-carboxypeptidase [Bacteroidia bacterium]|nr:LD-carboxypeptidase [Bacteroidia bacterium]